MKGFYRQLAPNGANDDSVRRRFTKGWRRKLVLSLLLFGTIICVSAFIRHSSAQSADELPGLAELKKGDYENAIRLLTTRLATNAADAEAETGLLRSYLETGRYAEAEAASK